MGLCATCTRLARDDRTGGSSFLAWAARHGEHLESWASQAETSPVSELRGFSNGLRKDWAAVTAGLTVSYSSGAVEGHVNRIKMIKRQMYERAKPDLLRKRVLLAD